MYFWKIEKLKEDIRTNQLTFYLIMEVMMLMPLEVYGIYNSVTNVLICYIRYNLCV